MFWKLYKQLYIQYRTKPQREGKAASLLKGNNIPVSLS